MRNPFKGAVIDYKPSKASSCWALQRPRKYLRSDSIITVFHIILRLDSSAKTLTKESIDPGARFIILCEANS